MRMFFRRKFLICVLGLFLVYLIVLTTFGEQYKVKKDVPKNAQMTRTAPEPVNWALLLRPPYVDNVSTLFEVPVVRAANHMYLLDENAYVSEDAVPVGHDAFSKHEFNQQASDSLGSDRGVADFRNDHCSDSSLKPDYNEELPYVVKKPRWSTDMDSVFLPSTAVIITFHNEARSTLLRTIVSVLRRSPPSLIYEIILVDDFSDDPQVGQVLSYLAKVRLIRNQRREGLVRSRLKGAAAASAPVLTFLDSHCECSWGWLPPLLHRIHQNPKAIVAPIIDILRLETFEYVPASSKLRGTFGWDLVFRWELLPEHGGGSSTTDTNSTSHITPDGPLNDTDPIPTPAIAGGLFSVSKETFFALGQYDPEMEVWGGENIELSIRAWLCGARLEIIPCSRVGHVFRRQHPYDFPGGSAFVFARNSRRAAEPWLDQYLPYFYASKPGVTLVPSGDLTSRIILRHRLRCRSFDWFLQHVYPDLLNQLPSLDPPTHNPFNNTPAYTPGPASSDPSPDPLLSMLLHPDEHLDVIRQVNRQRCANHTGSAHQPELCRGQLRHVASDLCLHMLPSSDYKLDKCGPEPTTSTWLFFNHTYIRHVSGKCPSTLPKSLLSRHWTLELLSTGLCYRPHKKSVEQSTFVTLLPTNQLALTSGHFCFDTIATSFKPVLKVDLCDPSSQTQQWTFDTFDTISQ